MLCHNHIRRLLAFTSRSIVHGWRPCRRSGDRMMFELIDPAAMVFIMFAVLGLIMAVAYGRM